MPPPRRILTASGMIPRNSAFRCLRWSMDLACLLVAWLAAAALLKYSFGPREAVIIASALGIRLLALTLLGSYRLVLRYTGLHALIGLSFGLALGTGLLVLAYVVVDHPTPAFICLEGLLATGLCAGNRMAVRVWHEWRSRNLGTRTLVFGAGELGEATCRALRRGGGLRPVAFLDDAPTKRGDIIHGRPVLGGLDDLAAVVKRTRAEVLVVSVHGLGRERLKAVFATAMAAGLRVKQVRGIDAMASGQGEVAIGDLAIEDLLRRPRRNLDSLPVQTLVRGQTVVVTGAGGSIGSELCRQACALGARRLVLVDQSEPALHAIARELEDLFSNIAVVEMLIDVTWAAPIEKLIATERPAVVFHAAAYKHVPIVEANPLIGVRNNVAGFLAVAQACIAAQVPRLVLVSTDKAVRPTNVMGATKRVCEVILQSLPAAQSHLGAVRFGNVLGSSGSVIPRFLDQIAAGGPVTVTHPDITRYFMLIPEAVELVLQAGALADHGEIFILDMGDPVRIADMARHLIHLTGHVPDKDIQIVYSGLRPGEKLYEELLVDEAERQSAVEGITVARNAVRPWSEVQPLVQDLLLACETQDVGAMAVALQALVPEWTASDGLEQEKQASLRRATNGSESGRLRVVN